MAKGSAGIIQNVKSVLKTKSNKQGAPVANISPKGIGNLYESGKRTCRTDGSVKR